MRATVRLRNVAHRMRHAHVIIYDQQAVDSRKVAISPPHRKVPMQFLFKAAGFLSVPSNAIAALAVAGLILLLARRRSGAAMAGVALAAMLLATLSPPGNLLFDESGGEVVRTAWWI
jgi:hypothetical protein